MFFTIFRYELRHWMRQPSVYVYAAIFLFASAGAMAARAGIFGEQITEPGFEILANAPLQLQEMGSFFLKLLLFLLPAVIGVSVHRDFKSNMYAVLYTYPFTKRSYLLAKFFSSFLVLMLITTTIGFGFYIGARLPGVDQALVGPFRAMAYLQLYLVYIIPNVLLFGGVVFAVVALSRNTYAGFITLIILFFIQMLAGSLLSSMDNRWLAAVLDPLGQKAALYSTRYWTFGERNELLPPVWGPVIYNRLTWLGISALIFGLGYKKFSLHHQPLSLWGGKYRRERKRERERKRSDNFGGIFKWSLPEVACDFSFGQQLAATWRLSAAEFAHILKSRLFLSILAGGILMVFFQQAELSPAYGFRLLPVTWKMLKVPAFLFLGVIHLLTFLYAGMLVHRARMASMDQLVDASPAPGWVLLMSKCLALVKMQAVLLALIIAGGAMVQACNGYYRFEIGLYLFHLYGLYLPGLVVWAFASLFVQTLFTNPYMGLFLLILGSTGITGLPELGVEHPVFRFNTAPEFTYSEMDGFGASLPPYFLYKFYWALGGLALLMGALLFGRRGLVFSFAERLSLAGERFRGPAGAALLVFFTGFLGLGLAIYYEDKYQYGKINSTEEEEQWMADNERKYKRYESTVQPRITAVKLDVALFPATRNFTAAGTYTLVNRSARTIDTILANYSYDEQTTYRLDRPARLLSRDTFICFDIHLLDEGLAPDDSLKMYFEVRNEPNSLFRSSSPVKQNGAFFTNEIFPGLGYRPIELGNNARRARYGLPPRKNDKPYPSDSTALYNSYSSRDSDWITFEATVSTSEDQVAIAPGYLQREWVDNGRRFFYYKMDSKIKGYYGFNSGRYDVKKDKWRGVGLEIYHHPAHVYNLNSMMRGMKGALAYNSRYFGPYQHRQARIIEFPLTLGGFATTFANSIPFSEAQFLTDVREQSIDFPFYIAAHEMAHQWWGNQLIPADVLGAKMLTESMAEYTALKVLEKEYGKDKVRRFLRFNLDLYLKGRGRESRRERPLIYAKPQQEYITYRKGALAFYALSDYIGEEKLNATIKSYLDEVRFQEAPYTTSLEMLSHIRQAVPDSLSYLIEVFFETITLYDNRLEKVEVKPLGGGRHQVDIEFIVSKYRNDEQGNRVFGERLSYRPAGLEAPIHSLPLADYVEIGIFGEGHAELYLRKHKVTRIQNRVRLIVNGTPQAVAVDPYYKLIDASPDDNWSPLIEF